MTTLSNDQIQALAHIQSQFCGEEVKASRPPAN